MAESAFTAINAGLQAMKPAFCGQIVCHVFVAFQALGIAVFRLIFGMAGRTLLFQIRVSHAQFTGAEQALQAEVNGHPGTAEKNNEE